MFKNTSVFFCLVLLHVFPGCSCIINRKAILAPLGFHQGILPKVSRQNWHLKLSQSQFTAAIGTCDCVTYKTWKLYLYVHFTVLAYFENGHIYLCCQKTIIYTIYADQNCVLKHKCHSRGKAHTEGADNCTIQYYLFSLLRPLWDAF